MQIKRRTKICALAAVLSAIVLISAIYAVNLPEAPSKSDNVPSAAPLKTTSDDSMLKAFASIADLENFLETNANSTGSFAGGPLDSQYFGSSGASNATSAASSPSFVSAASTPSSGGASQQSGYSSTNVQLSGVDEADTVKTDGQYIYVADQNWNSLSQNNVYVLNADPQNPTVVSKIAFGNDTELAGLYLSQDNNTLVVLGSNYANIVYPIVPSSEPSGGQFYPGFANWGVSSFIYVYNVTDKASPTLDYNLTLTGSYFTSRMIGDDVYFVVSQPATLLNGAVVLPTVYNNAAAASIIPPNIYYTYCNRTFYTYTTFFGLNIEDPSQTSNMTVLMSGTSSTYISQNNAYILCPTQDWQGTDIYRAGINGLSMTFQAEGYVPGVIANLDEYNGYLRVAARVDMAVGQSTQNLESNLYVLDMNLTVVGQLENMGPGENIYDARFTGDTCYMVIDPMVTLSNQTELLYVIDLSNPQAPRVADELEIPDYSTSLYPYDATHIIGVDQQFLANNVTNCLESINLNLSLFDTSNLNNPVEVANYIVPGNYTYSGSLVQNDPQAFLFDQQKQLLVIPVLVEEDTVDIWMGVYVFNVNPATGFTLRGTVTNLNPMELNSQGFLDARVINEYGNDQITRSLCIGNTLYTVSNNEVKLTSLTDLSQIAQIYLN